MHHQLNFWDTIRYVKIMMCQLLWLKLPPPQQHGCGGDHTNMLPSLVYIGPLLLGICSGKRVRLRRSKWGLGSMFMWRGDKHFSCPLEKLPVNFGPPPLPPQIYGLTSSWGTSIWKVGICAICIFSSLYWLGGGTIYKALNLHSMRWTNFEIEDNVNIQRWISKVKQSIWTRSWHPRIRSMDG